jgi:hypothetical protein
LPNTGTGGLLDAPDTSLSNLFGLDLVVGVAVLAAVVLAVGWQLNRTKHY